MLLANFLSWGMFLAGLVLMIAILMRRHLRHYGWRWRPRRQVLQRKRPTQTQVSQHLPLADAPPEYLRWQVEMHETAREIQAELDSKIRVLNALVVMARQETARLRDAVVESQRSAL